MSSFECEKCHKKFAGKSQHTRHKNRKTPCVQAMPKDDLPSIHLRNSFVVSPGIAQFTTFVPHSVNTTKDNGALDKQHITIDNSTFAELQKYYDEILNTDKSTYKSSNDEPTPIGCIVEMMNKVPDELWRRPNLSILDPCCGNGNFGLPILFELIKHHDKRTALEQILEFSDINEDRLANVRRVFCMETYNLQVSSRNFLEHTPTKLYDLIPANPPYAKLLENGKRASKNHNLIKEFIEKALSMLKPDGYLVFITPDNWMSYADRNVLIDTLTRLQIVHLDIHSAKKYFKKIGSSFTWYIIQNRPYYKDMNVSGIWKKREYEGSVVSAPRKYIPLVYDQTVQSILSKTVDNSTLAKFEVKTSSDLHKYTKAEFIRDTLDETYKHRLIHTPSQTVYASRPHKYQDGYKVFLSTTDKYNVFVDNCGMTQSIVFVLCASEAQAKKYVQILQHPLYVFINNICRWGNFNNIRILQSFPIPDIEYSGDHAEIYRYFGIGEVEIQYIQSNM
jgi:tRNA1(Val) A37 N6-methylase TrmN6